MQQYNTMTTKILKSTIECLTDFSDLEDGVTTEEVQFEDDIEAIAEIERYTKWVKYGYHLPEEAISTTKVVVMDAWQWDGEIKLPFNDFENLENAIIKNLPE